MKSPLYVIVRFEVKNEDLKTVIDTIMDFFEKEVSTFDGFISYKLHLNEEGTVLINYATWKSKEHFQKFRLFASTSEISKKIQSFQPRADMVYEISL